MTGRLRPYRDMEGLTQVEMGELLGIADYVVSRIESGRRPLDVAVAVTGYSQERFAAVPHMSEPLHRKLAATPEAARRRAKELLRLGGEVFLALQQRTPRAPSMLLTRLPTAQSMDEVEDYSVEVRAGVLAHEETGPIRNLTSAVERAGVCLVPVSGLRGISGLSSWVDNEQPVIGLDPTQPGDRFRFTLLHELAHLLIHRKGSRLAEDEANRFAGAALMPRNDLDEAMEETLTLSDFVALKKRWRISVAALVYRAKELQYIDERRYRSLQIQMSKWRRKEPAKFDATPGELLPRLVEVHGGLHTVARDLGINSQHLRMVIDWRRLRLA